MMTAQPEWVDWESIREAEGFKVGDPVRARGRAVGFIVNLIRVKGRYRARVNWPTIPFECDGVILCPLGPLIPRKLQPNNY